jgi:hypothetical protein
MTPSKRSRKSTSKTPETPGDGSRTRSKSSETNSTASKRLSKKKDDEVIYQLTVAHFIEHEAGLKFGDEARRAIQDSVDKHCIERRDLVGLQSLLELFVANKGVSEAMAKLVLSQESDPGDTYTGLEALKKTMKDLDL